MTTLRTFQNEIDDIHNREISKQRAQASTLHDKGTQKALKGKAKEDPAPKLAQTTYQRAADPDPPNLQEIEDRILVRHELPHRIASWPSDRLDTDMHIDLITLAKFGRL